MIKRWYWPHQCNKHIFQICWRQGEIPIYWKKENWIYLCKQEKADYCIPKTCGGINLPSIVGKVFKHISKLTSSMDDHTKTMGCLSVHLQKWPLHYTRLLFPLRERVWITLFKRKKGQAQQLLLFDAMKTI